MAPVRNVPFSAIRPADYNPRSMSPAAFEGLVASIERFGLVEPPVWNERTGNIVGGHRRIEAVEVLRRAGRKSLPCAVVDLPLEEEKALNVTLNNPSIQGEFNEDLGPLLAELSVGMEEAFAQLRLDDLVENDPGPPEEFGRPGAEKKGDYRCPSCGHEWNGQPRPRGGA